MRTIQSGIEEILERNSQLNCPRRLRLARILANVIDILLLLLLLILLIFLLRYAFGGGGPTDKEEITVVVPNPVVQPEEECFVDAGKEEIAKMQILLDDLSNGEKSREEVKEELGIDKMIIYDDNTLIAYGTFLDGIEIEKFQPDIQKLRRWEGYQELTVKYHE